MKWLKAVLAVQMALALCWSSPHAWSQEEDFDLEAEIEASESDMSEEAEINSEDLAESDADEEVSFDDFAETEDSPAEKNEEMTLEPLEGSEDQVTETPAEEPAPEPTPEEMMPEPPSVAEPAEPTPEPSAPEPSLAQEDLPDLDFENRLHDIYINYHSRRMTSSEWAELLGSRESEIYTIQRGDTLWSISKTFFNDGNYWPKIWQLNSGITNPHLIEPGHAIRFLLGTQSDTPAFAVTETAEDPVEMPVGEGGIAGLEPEAPRQPKIQAGKSADGTPSDDIEIPPPSEEYRPVLKRIPPSLPEWALQRKGETYDSTGVDYGRRPILDLPDKKYLEGFIDEEKYQADGEVSEIEGGGRTAANFQYVFVTLPPGQGQKGDQYTVIRRIGRVPRVSTEVATPAYELGYQYQVQGLVRLEELLSTSSSGKEIYRAFVLESLSQIEKGSMVSKGPLPTLSLKSAGEKSDVIVQIVGGHNINNQKTLALHSLAYLSGGSKEGLSEGQILTVRANTRLRNQDSIIKESYIPVGLLRVVRVGERFSTGIVLKVWDAIFVGDVTGAGKVVPPEPPERRSRAKASASADFEDLDESFEGELDDSDFEDSNDAELSEDLDFEDEF